tara:strand:+ start:1216 stop:1695 length:480 start_codon:yes stop_codon:yes gene_type:complete
VKKTCVILLFLFITNSCFERPKSISDREILIKLHENKIYNEYSIDSIITYKAPSIFKNISVDFDIHQVIYKIDNQKKGSKFYTLTKNEIFRLGKGLNCIIISKEKRWTKTGKKITDLKLWFINNKKEKLLDKPINTIKLSEQTSKEDNLPENLKKVICN